MRYVISDIHGEYGLCMRLLEKIKFSGGDTLYVCGDIIDKGMEDLRRWFPCDGKLLGWDIIDKLEALPLFIEEEEFICVHAGLPLDDDRRIVPPQSVKDTFLLNDRSFLRPEVVPKDGKCVCDYYKIHLDTGTWLGGPLGCLCIDTCTSRYVKKLFGGRR